jgi:(2R)-sulfolactate sulfo-lyase subunit alpha
MAHHRGDHVGVAVMDVAPGPATIGYLDDTDASHDEVLEIAEPIPLGHKVALVDLEADQPVIEYGTQVGVTRCPITAGHLVHTHNLRSARWQTSVA